MRQLEKSVLIHPSCGFSPPAAGSQPVWKLHICGLSCLSLGRCLKAAALMHKSCCRDLEGFCGSGTVTFERVLRI